MLRLSELALDLREDELGEGAAFLVNADVDSAVFCDYCIRAQSVVLARNLTRKLCVRGRR